VSTYADGSDGCTRHGCTGRQRRTPAQVVIGLDTSFRAEATRHLWDPSHRSVLLGVSRYRQRDPTR
jgi:hypothetical protein